MNDATRTRVSARPDSPGASGEPVPVAVARFLVATRAGVLGPSAAVDTGWAAQKRTWRSVWAGDPGRT